MKKPFRRWRLIKCFEGEPKEVREEKARKLIADLAEDGFKAKIYAPLPEHKTSGHTHVVALCTLEEKLLIGGIFKKVSNRFKVVRREISTKRLNEIAESLRKQRGFFYVGERSSFNEGVDKTT